MKFSKEWTDCVAEMLVSLERVNCTSPRSVITFLCQKPEEASWVQSQVQEWYMMVHGTSMVYDLGDYWGRQNGLFGVKGLIWKKPTFLHRKADGTSLKSKAVWQTSERPWRSNSLQDSWILAKFFWEPSGLWRIPSWLADHCSTLQLPGWRADGLALQVATK